jgi:molybdate transport system substrate-binding protein
MTLPVLVVAAEGKMKAIGTAWKRAGRTALIVGLIVVAIGSTSAGGRLFDSSAAAATSGTLTVFAAASLTDAFTLLGTVLEQRNPGLRLTMNFAGSQQLAQQIEQGAKADVFASADQRWMDYLRQHGLIEGSPQEFARNLLVVIVPRSNPGRIARLEDLSRPGVKLVINTEAVPAGKYSREALMKLNAAPGFPPDYAQQVLRNVVSEEDNVKSVVTKVQLGEADAGMVYRSDVTPAVAGKLRVIAIPAKYNVLASYPIALVKNAPNADAGHEFIDLVLSPAGQRVLSDQNFIPVTAP